jgi:hypothetical protein
MAMMLKVCDVRERNPGGDPRYRYIAGRIDEQTRIVLMPSREEGAGAGDWVLYIAPDARPPAAEAAAETPED